MRAVHMMSDMFYVPAQMRKPVIEVLQIFFEHKVFLEITVPTVIACLSTGGDELIPSSEYGIWDETRRQPSMHFKKYLFPGSMYFHPVKWSGLSKGVKEAAELYCNVVLPLVYDPNFTIQ